MRDYATISPKFWIGETGRQLRGDADAQRVAFYLLTCPNANMIGLFYLPLPTLCHEIGISFEGASKGLRRLFEVGFCVYHPETEWVWVFEMARHQVGEKLAAKDNLVKHVRRLFAECHKSPFAKEFYQYYGNAFHLEQPPAVMESRSPFEAPSKPLRNQEPEVPDQEHEPEPEQEHPPGPPEGGNASEDSDAYRLDGKAKRSKRKTFTAPTVDEVHAYCASRKNSIDAEEFVAHYAARGWRSNSGPIKDWRAAVVVWEKYQLRFASTTGGKQRSLAGGPGQTYDPDAARRDPHYGQF